LEKLRAERNEICARFLRNKCDIADFCIALDLVGKKFVDNCLMASAFQNSKFQTFITFASVQLVSVFDNETVLTRLILKAFIEHLTTMQPSRPGSPRAAGTPATLGQGLNVQMPSQAHGMQSTN
jgi:hypothetical protein